MVAVMGVCGTKTLGVRTIFVDLIVFATFVYQPYLVTSQSPSQPDPTCPDMSPPDHGAVSFTWDCKRNRMAVFTCEPGHILYGSGVMFCNGIQWNGTKPVCHVQDCLAHFEAGSKEDGVYGLAPDGATQKLAYCDMTTAGGGWTVFQRRIDNFTDFYRDWQDYKHGFGDVQGNFWLGLEDLHHLTHKESELWIFMEAEQGQIRFAMYDTFCINGEMDNYRLTASNYQGNAGDSLSYHSGYMFSTRDRDNDVSPDTCARSKRGAWWYQNCASSNLNGVYLNGHNNIMKDMGIIWTAYKGRQYSLKNVEMMVRRKQT